MNPPLFHVEHSTNNPERTLDIQPNQELIELMREISMFQEFEASERAALALYMKPETFEPGRDIIREGDPGGKLYLLHTGSVEVQKQRSHGSGRIVIARFERGGVIGEMSLLDRMPRSATIVTVQPTKMFVFTQEALDELIGSNPALAIKLLRGLAVLVSLRLRNTSGWFADVF